MARHIAAPRGLAAAASLAVVLGAIACAGSISDPFTEPGLLDATATQGAAFIEPQPVGSEADDLIACPIAVRLATSDADITLTRLRLETRQRVDGGERAELEWLEGAALTRWFERRLPAAGTDTARLGLAGPRPFDWDLEVFFKADGRRGEVSRMVSGRCGPPIPSEGGTPEVSLVEVIGGGAGAQAGDTIEVAYRVTAPAGLWSLQESTYFLTAIDTAPPRTFASGPTTVDRRRRYVLVDRGGVPLDWTVVVRTRDLREGTSMGELRVAWDQPLAGEPANPPRD